MISVAARYTLHLSVEPVRGPEKIPADAAGGERGVAPPDRPRVDYNMRAVALSSRAAVSLTARSAFLTLAAITISACHTEVTAPDLFGTWGGDHIRLEVSGTGATLEYDCAVGTIEGSILPHDGRFSASGTHTFEHGGPINQDELPDTHPASYEGQTDGRRMTLTVTLDDTGQVIGTYTLALGGVPRVFKCL